MRESEILGIKFKRFWEFGKGESFGESLIYTNEHIYHKDIYVDKRGGKKSYFQLIVLGMEFFFFFLLLGYFGLYFFKWEAHSMMLVLRWEKVSPVLCELQSFAVNQIFGIPTVHTITQMWQKIFVTQKWNNNDQRSNDTQSDSCQISIGLWVKRKTPHIFRYFSVFL